MLLANMSSDGYICKIEGSDELVKLELGDALLTYFFMKEEYNLKPNLEFDFEQSEDIDRFIDMFNNDIEDIMLAMAELVADPEYRKDKASRISVYTDYDINALLRDAKKEKEKEKEEDGNK